MRFCCVVTVLAGRLEEVERTFSHPSFSYSPRVDVSNKVEDNDQGERDEDKAWAFLSRGRYETRE